MCKRNLDSPNVLTSLIQAYFVLLSFKDVISFNKLKARLSFSKRIMTRYVEILAVLWYSLYCGTCFIAVV